MLDNFIRGGQLFLHNLVMLKQVLAKSFIASLFVSFIITGYLYYDKFRALDYKAALTYTKAGFTQSLKPYRSSINKNTRNKPVRIDAYDNLGLYAKDIAAAKILKHPRFKHCYIIFKGLLVSASVLLLELTLALVFLISIIWVKFGRSAKTSKLIKGGVVLTAEEVSGILKKQKLASSFTVGDMPLVKDQETRHILVTGMTGSGKTNLFNTLLPQIRQKNQPALVIDQTGEMIARFYSPTRGDIIFNPFDERSYAWDFWNEISDGARLNSLASSIFCNIKTSTDAMWNNSSKQVFIDSVLTLSKIRENRSLKKLYELIAVIPLKEASKKLANTASSTLLDPVGDKTAASIRSNTISFISWLEYLASVEEKSFSNRDLSNINDINNRVNANNANKINKFTIKELIRSNVSNDKGPWIFIGSVSSQRSIMQPLQSILLELTILSLQDLLPDHNRRFWIIADELASLKKLQILPQGLSELRKYGGCILAGLQSMNQIFDLYGHYQGNTMFGQFATKFFFRSDEPAISKLICEMIGSAEYLESQKQTSYGAHEHRDGISYAQQTKQRPLVTHSDLSSLSNLECYVQLPLPEARISKIKTKYVK